MTNTSNYTDLYYCTGHSACLTNNYTDQHYYYTDLYYTGHSTHQTNTSNCLTNPNNYTDRYYYYTFPCYYYYY